MRTGYRLAFAIIATGRWRHSWQVRAVNRRLGASGATGRIVEKVDLTAVRFVTVAVSIAGWACRIAAGARLADWKRVSYCLCTIDNVRT